jgi:predicted lipoprotein with Yx(FWY)xxD motif
MKRTYALLAVLALAIALAAAACGGGSSTSATGGEGAASTEAESASSEGGGYSYKSGGGSSASSTESESEPATASAEGGGAPAPVSVGEAANVGKVLVDSEGMTHYYFQKDQKGSGVSKCEGACAEAWPPLTTGGEPEAMSGVNASMLGAIERSDGTMQVTYAGWPLYTFVEDKKAGEDNGTDSKAFGASWYPLHPNGQKAGH